MEEKLGDYRLIKLIGHGLFGKVYLAEHLYMQQQVTLKVLPSELAKDRSFLSRLQKEIAAVSSIDHPHVAKVQSVSFAEGKYFVVTDYVPSPHGAEPMNLNDYIREVSPKEPLKEKVVLGLARQVASALDAIHAKNVNGAPLAHLALRPSNILVSNMLTQPSFILTDTGMTRVVGVSSCFDAILEDMKSDGERAAVLEGKRARFVQNYSFLAPEQKLSRDEQLHGYRCDLYALGTLLYYLLVRSYPEGVFPLPSLHRSLLLNWDRLIMGLLKQDPSQRVPLEPGKLLETINSIAVPADKRSPMQETQKPKQESSAPKREAEIPLQKNGAKALQSASHNVSQNAALDSFQGPFQGAPQGAPQNTPQTATQNIPQNTPHNIPQRTLQSASQSSCQSKAQRRSLSEPLSEPLSEYSAGVSPKALGASQSANAPAAPSVSLSRQDSRSPAAAALATEVVKTSSSLSLDRPQVDRPQVDRPQVDRPQVDRPQVDRPQVDRPQVDRPQVDSAVDKDQERLKQMASFQAHAVEEKRPGDVQAKSSSLSEPSWRSEPLESSELKKETKGFQFFDRASGREKELEEKEAQILGRASAYVDRLDRSSVASPPKQRVVIQEARLESEKRESASSGGAIFPSEASSAVGTFRSMTREPEADNRVEPILCDMVQIKGGKYLRGSNDGSRDEMPVHEVEIEDFALDTHPVTNEQFLRFLQHFGSEKDNSNNDMIRLKESRIKRSGGKLIVEAGYAKHPIVGVTWYGATAYCRWVGKRLPTEVEWEVASRGGDAAAIYPCGEKIEKQQANFFNSDTTTVKSYPPNGLGLYDMAGNVYEWCADWYAYNTYELSASEPYCPKGPLQGVYRVLRGGCWKSLKEDLRCAHRHRNNPGAINRTYGFRCAADTAQKAGKVEKKRAKARPKESAGEKESAT